MSNLVTTAIGPKQISSSANVSSQRSYLAGIFVSTASSTPTITVYDSAGTTTTAKIVDTFTPAAATWYPMPFIAQTGIYVVIAGTVSCTVAAEAA